MPRLLSVTVVFAFFVSPSNPQDDSPPPGEAPNFYRATAFQIESGVEIILERPEFVAPRKGVFPEPMRWQKLRPAILTKTCRAFHADGKSIDAATLLKKLRKPQGVVAFVRYTGDDFKTDPHPYYLSLIRENTIVLVVDANAVLDLRP